jgi:hypothetical protein
MDEDKLELLYPELYQQEDEHEMLSITPSIEDEYSPLQHSHANQEDYAY